MTKLGFAKDIAGLLRNAQTLWIVAPAAVLSKRKFPKPVAAALGPLADLVLELAKGVSPGDQGAARGTLTQMAGPRRLRLGVLPDQVSRFNSPARAHAVRNVISGLARGGDGKTAVLLVLDEPEHYSAAVNSVARVLPLFSRKTKQKQRKSPKRGASQVQVCAVTTRGKNVRADAIIKATAESVREAARLCDTPPSELDPAGLARQAKALLRGIAGVRVREIVGKDLVAEGLGGVHGVGRAALSPPRVVIATWKPTRVTGPHVALVGKGVTYDTGGLNIKVGGSMSGMKADMGGAAAVLGAFRTLALTKCKRRVSLVLCIAENAIGPASYKPDDILVMHSGKTVEINNTDAEGRLLLADGVSYAARKLGAEIVLDAATLTGAQVISTGTVHAGIVSNEDELERLFVDAGRASGDLCHPMIFAPELFQAEFASRVADMKNSVKNRRNAQSSCAAQFVHSHLEGCDVRWCHVDMAGPSRRDERGTGYGVALLREAVARL